MNENFGAADSGGKAAHKEVAGDILAPRRQFTIDCAKMRRWHGAPPLMLGQSERDFQDFIASLATCVDRGDAMTESLVYRFGVERYRMGQLLFQRAKLSLVHHYLFVEFKCRDEERRKHRESKKEGSDTSDFIKTARPSVVDSTLIFEATDDIRRNMHYKPEHKLDEMAAALEFEAAIDRYDRIEVLIDDCDARAKVLLRQISLHDIQIAERLEAEANERWGEVLEAILDEQLRERQAKFALRSSGKPPGDAEN